MIDPSDLPPSEPFDLSLGALRHDLDDPILNDDLWLRIARRDRPFALAALAIAVEAEEKGIDIKEAVLLGVRLHEARRRQREQIDALEVSLRDEISDIGPAAIVQPVSTAPEHSSRVRGNIFHKARLALAGIMWVLNPNGGCGGGV
jgi:hypothetical protein